jgi:hypothetical protein
MKPVGAVLLGIWVVSLPLLSFARVQTWTDERSLWESAAFFAPYKLRPEMQAAFVAAEQGDEARAIEGYLIAIAYWERGRPAHERAGCEIAARNLSTLYGRRGDFALAERWGAYRCDWPR